MNTILLIDDDKTNLQLIKQLLVDSYEVLTAISGEMALKFLEKKKPDLILLDYMMPEMDGPATLRKIRENPENNNIPIVFLTASTNKETEVECLNLGAVDFITKPVVLEVMKSRILRIIQLQETQNKLVEERDHSRHLLLNILPPLIADRLEIKKDEIIADHFDSVSVLFSDLVGFTAASSQITANQLVSVLNDLFIRFDTLSVEYKIEKIKTIGDAYMAVCGLPEKTENNEELLIRFAIAMYKALEEFNKTSFIQFGMRIGMSSGPVTAGVIGKKKFAYDIWGDTVNVASRMETSGKPGCIHVSESIYQKTKDLFTYMPCEPTEIKGKGLMNTYLLKVIDL